MRTIFHKFFIIFVYNQLINNKDKWRAAMRAICVLLAVLGILFIHGCEQETLPAVPKQMEVLISVNVNDESVTFFDIQTGRKVTEWKLRKRIKGAVLLPDDRTMLLYGNELDRVYLYDMRTGEEKSEWKTGKGIVGALVSNKGNKVFLADERQKALRIFDLKGKEKAKIEVGNKPLTLLQNKAGTTIYVIDFHNTKAYAVDVGKRRVIRTFSVPKFAFGGLLRDGRQELWIGGHGSGSTVETNIRIYSIKTGALIKLMKAPSMPVSFVETNEGIFALSHGSNILRKWDDSGNLKASVTIGANPFIMIGANERLYIASYDSNEIYVVDQRTMKIIARWKTGKGPFQLLIRKGNDGGKENGLNRG
jgi:YVTN family beta-propeller protein